MSHISLPWLDYCKMYEGYGPNAFLMEGKKFLSLYEAHLLSLPFFSTHPFGRNMMGWTYGRMFQLLY
jgi:hypothetical protein